MSWLDEDPQVAEFLRRYQLSQEQERALKMQKLSDFGFGMMGARKGQELQAVGRAGLLAGEGYRRNRESAQQENMGRLQMTQFAQRMAEQERARAEQERQQQGMRAATQAATTAPMGPPTPDGQMQPGGFDFERFAVDAAQFDPRGSLSMLQQLRPKQAEEKSPWAQINPKDFTPESLREFGQTKDPTVLKARVDPKESSPFGKVSPGDFSPQSLAKYAQSGNYADLVPIDKTPRTSIIIDNAPKLPAGYRWKDGMVGQQVEAIPGGPADTSKQDASVAANRDASQDVVMAAIQDAKKLVSFRSAGVGGYIPGKIPGTNATDLQKRLDTVKANIGFDRLQRMRDESKTGGALGQVAVQELNMLQATLASLDREQSPGQLMQSLDRIEKHYKTANTLLDRIRKGERGAGASGDFGGGNVVDFGSLPK
jgi:hypothetical protein